MTKPIEDSANASAIRTALDVPTNAALTAVSQAAAAKYTKPANGIPATDLDADPAGRTLLTATSAAERKQALGLGNVDNTSDANKPVSTAQATALAAKIDATLPALQTVFDGGTAAQKAAFQASVSADGPAKPARDPTPSIIGPGNLTGSYYWKVTYVWDGGETDANTAMLTGFVCSGNKVFLGGIPTSPDSRVTARKIYRNSMATTPATALEALQYVGTISDNTNTTWEDNVPDASLGAFIPRVSDSLPKFSLYGKHYYRLGDLSCGFGQDALGNGTGYACTAVGSNALKNVVGDRNTAVGVFAGYSLTTGRWNTAIGTHALNFSKACESNTAVGYGAIFKNTGTGVNTAIGAYALYSFDSPAGGGNTAIGKDAQYSATTGSSNTSVGYYALRNNTTGGQNSIIGYGAGDQITGNFNTAFGFSALGDKTSGNFNSVFGWTAGKNVSVFDRCILFGAYAGVRNATSNRIIFDTQDRATEAGEVDGAIVHGDMSSTVANQRLRLNALVRPGVGSAPTVSTLPAASAALRGYRGYVTDASVAYTPTNVGSTVAGGGSNCVPVFCTGAAWVIG